MVMAHFVENFWIRPYVGCLVQYLPLLWKQSEEHNMLRCAILTTLIHLVQGLGADSKNLYPFLLPVIQLSTDVSQPPHVYLLEDGLELWLVTLENSPCVTPELLRIFQNMSPLLELSSENLRTCFKIINGYIFLSSTEFLQTYAAGLCQSFYELLPEITTEGQVQVLKVCLSEVSDLLEQELQTVVSCHVGVRIEPRSSGRSPVLLITEPSLQPPANTIVADWNNVYPKTSLDRDELKAFYQLVLNLATFSVP